VQPIRVLADAVGVYHQYVVKLADRDGARAALSERGISTGVHYPIPLHRQPALEALAGDRFPAAEALAEEVLSLPVYPELTDDQRDSVVAALATFVAPAREIGAVSGR
jgi:dTDP-4-amino-4,6-dideoxygalactose transaminase